MRLGLKLATLGALIYAAPALAMVGADPKPQAVAAGKTVPEKKICRRVVPTGSIMAIKTCRTQKAWDELSAGGQENIRQMRDRSQATMGSPNGD